MGRMDKYSLETQKKIADYKTKYIRSHYTSIGLKFHNEKDKDVIEKIYKSGNATDYVRKLVKKSIKKG